MIDSYTILGISRNATKEEAKIAFRKLAHIHHPDKGGDVKKFQEINSAYTAIMNGDNEPVRPVYSKRNNDPYNDPFIKKYNDWYTQESWYRAKSEQDQQTAREEARRRQEDIRKKDEAMRLKLQISLLLQQLNRVGGLEGEMRDGKMWYYLK